MSTAMIANRVAKGSLIRATRGVYAVGHAAPSEFANEVTALLAAPSGSRLSHLTAARLWALHMPGPDLLPTDIRVGDGGGRRRSGVREHRTSHPERFTHHYVHGLPVTSVVQTLVDIAPLLTLRELERALDEALALGLTSRHAVADATERNLRRPGSGHLRLLAELRGPLTLTRSQAEERFLELVRAAGLPAPETNVRLHGFTVDFLWRDAGVVVEIDGYQWHSSRSAFERDHRKDMVLRGAGLSLTRLTWEAINRRPLEIVARLAAEVATRTRHGAGVPRDVASA